MASGINKVILIGNFGQDPKVRRTSNGEAVVTLAIATSERWKDQAGQFQERTEWHRVVLWRRMAEIAEQYLSKGSKVYIEGQVRTRKWQDQNSQDRYSTEVVVGRSGTLQMLDNRGSKTAAAHQETPDSPIQSQSTQPPLSQPSQKDSNQPTAPSVIIPDWSDEQADWDKDIPF